MVEGLPCRVLGSCRLWGPAWCGEPGHLIEYIPGVYQVAGSSIPLGEYTNRQAKIGLQGTWNLAGVGTCRVWRTLSLARVYRWSIPGGWLQYTPRAWPITQSKKLCQVEYLHDCFHCGGNTPQQADRGRLRAAGALCGTRVDLPGQYLARQGPPRGMADHPIQETVSG